jgi:hypothetical protein
LITDPASQVEAVRNMNQGSLLPTLAAIYSAGSGSSVGQATVPTGYTVGSSILQQSNVVDVIVDGPDAQGVAKLANAIARAGGDQFATLYSTFAVKIMHPAATPTAPSAPKPLRDAAVAGLVALAVGYLVALVRYTRRAGQRQEATASVSGSQTRATEAPREVSSNWPDATDDRSNSSVEQGTATWAELLDGVNGPGTSRTGHNGSPTGPRRAELPTSET